MSEKMTVDEALQLLEWMEQDRDTAVQIKGEALRECQDAVAQLRIQLEMADAETVRLGELVEETQTNYELVIDMNRTLRAEKTAFRLVLDQINGDADWQICGDSCVEFARPKIRKLLGDTTKEPQ